MTSTEKAEAALNTRLERLQANLRESRSDAGRRFLLQSLVICLGLGEGLTDYVKMIGHYAQGRYRELKQMQTALTTEHAEWLSAGTDLLERLKVNPSDRILRQEIEVAQRNMAAIQKKLRRGADTLQRDLAPSMAMVDKLAVSVRRFGEAADMETLKRVLEALVDHARELYRVQPVLASRNLIDSAEWRESGFAEIEQATEFYDAFASAGYQAVRTLEVMTMAVSQTPPVTTEEVIQRANEAVSTRLGEIAARLADGTAN